jgi:hypothetical protein
VLVIPKTNILSDKIIYVASYIFLEKDIPYRNTESPDLYKYPPNLLCLCSSGRSEVKASSLLTASRMDSGWCLLLIVVVLCKCVEATEYLKYKDPSQPVNARVEDLLSRMTLEEKIGQMTQIERSVATADVMKNYYIGITHTLCIHLFTSKFFSFSISSKRL